MSMETLPHLWTQVPIEDCLLAYPNGRRIRQGWSPQCENHPAETLDDWGVLKTSAIQDGEYVETANKHIPSKLKPRTQLEVETGDILITCAGPRSRCGVTCLVRKTRPKLLISGKMYQLRADPEIIDRHLLELFLREPGTKHKIDEMKTGISDSGLNLTHGRFSMLEVPLPPHNEQQRIVAKIEELFSELDAGEESLRRARRLLGVYRQSLLKQAFEGKLTAPWRAQNPHLLESPATSNISAEELKGLAELPPGWRHTRFGEFVHHIDAGKSFRCEERRPKRNEIGVAKVSAVSWGEYDEAESKTCMDPEKVNLGYLIRPGDFILSRANTIELVGACVIVHHVTQRVMLSDKTLRLTIDNERKPFLLNFLRSRKGRQEIEKRSTGNQESMRNIGQERIRSIIIPECTLPEQQEIVRLLDEQFTAIEQNEREIDAALKRSAALRQSILKKAFTGQLVLQDPSDEPASQLLERICAERETAAKAPKKKAAKKIRP